MRSKTHNGVVVFGEVKDHRDGTYTITLTPQTAGPHQLLITMDSQHVQNSPNDLDVRPKLVYHTLCNAQQVIQCNRSTCVAIHDNGDIYVGSHDGCIYVFDQIGQLKNTIGVYVRMYGDPNRPSGITIDDEGYSLVSEYGGHCLSIYDPEGNKIHTVRNLNNPYGTALDPRDGSVFIANCGANTVLKETSMLQHILHTTIKVFTQEGVYVRMYGGPNGPIGIAIDDEGYSLVSERSSNCLSIYDPEGNKIHAVKNLKNPIGAKLDGSVFIANCGANTIMKILKRDEKKMEKDERAVEWKIAKKCKLCDIKEATERTQHGPSSQPTQK
ncbi:hypothetical protein EMCRGX_G012788 [Ephydatia muelleri]